MQSSETDTTSWEHLVKVHHLTRLEWLLNSWITLQVELSKICRCNRRQIIHCLNREKNKKSFKTVNLYMYKMRVNLYITIRRFLFENQKVIVLALLCYTIILALKKFAQLFHPIRSETTTNRNSLAHVFPCFASTSCHYLLFWLVHCVAGVLNWLEWLLYCWFYDT